MLYDNALITIMEQKITVDVAKLVVNKATLTNIKHVTNRNTAGGTQSLHAD